MSQPFYHLRPNKYVDRFLFISALERLNSFISLEEHQYVGFGSFVFDDFKLMHERLNISSMISLESDETIFHRAQYNSPYNCINIINQSSTDFISGGQLADSSSIIWLDYTAPGELAQQFSDVATLTNILNPHDIIRVTFNATASALGAPTDNSSDLLEYRMEILKERIGEHIPVDVSVSEIESKKYPLLLLKCLRKMISGLFIPTKFDKRFLCPLFSTIYKDGHTMLTFTGIILDNNDEQKIIESLFKGIPYINLKWDTPSRIDMPELTVREILGINKMLPDDNAFNNIKNNFNFIFSGKDSEDELKSYMSFYKYYPNFQSINF